jgi:hypothetical protein
MHNEHFNPFESRLCRTVRNELGQALLAAIPAGEFESITRYAQGVVPIGAGSAVEQYVKRRLKGYRTVLDAMNSGAGAAGNPWRPAVLLWNQGFFFECHEWLESRWRRSAGPEKKMIQTLIWAAGVYSHLEYGRAAEAGKLAARAVEGLKQYRGLVPAPFDVDRLIAKLEALDPIPPQFNPEKQDG